MCRTATTGWLVGVQSSQAEAGSQDRAVCFIRVGLGLSICSRKIEVTEGDVGLENGAYSAVNIETAAERSEDFCLCVVRRSGGTCM